MSLTEFHLVALETKQAAREAGRMPRSTHPGAAASDPSEAGSGSKQCLKVACLHGPSDPGAAASDPGVAASDPGAAAIDPCSSPPFVHSHLSTPWLVMVRFRQRDCNLVR